MWFVGIIKCHPRCCRQRSRAELGVPVRDWATEWGVVKASKPMKADLPGGAGVGAKWHFLQYLCFLLH